VRLMPASPGFGTNSATLLVVDDDAGAREGLRSVFESAGHRTLTVADAPAALRLLKKESCDLVMLDVELPEVDGLSLCRLLRAQPAMRQLPVLVFSANDSELKKVEAFSAGVDDYIVKPSTPGELISRVNSHLNFAQRESDLIGSNRECASSPTSAGACYRRSNRNRWRAAWPAPRSKERTSLCVRVL